MFSKFKWPALVGAACAVTILCSAVLNFSQSPLASVQLVTEPPITQVSPLEAEATEYLGSGQYQPPVQLKLHARDATGAPLQNARFHLNILTPPPTPWFTTDFPIVEGTTLLDMEANAPTGELQIQQVFPIRGNYQLQVNVTPMMASAFVPITQTLNLTVPENPFKIRYFILVLAVLLAIGFGGGWIIGGRQEVRTGEIAPRRVRLLLSGVSVLAIAALLFFNISTEFVEAHAGMAKEAPTDPNPGLIASQGLNLELTGDKQTAVGKTVSFQAKLTDSQTNQPVSDAVFSIKSTQLENNWVAFAYQGISDAQGLLAWQEQFFDGAPHNIEVEVSPSPNSQRQFQPFQATREIEVEGIAPPMSVRLVGLFYFTGVLGLGLLAGLWLQRRCWQQI
ncbi:MAG: hypothetical protein HC851_01025 [Acaryochloris sp. RU_4_1]|nr:hypothetical protein [Acaryochloris sp. RU_4_1]NJR53627.1 hypothetical protein [Acaryochloris sp. CRU_2_0]